MLAIAGVGFFTWDPLLGRCRDFLDERNDTLFRERAPDGLPLMLPLNRPLKNLAGRSFFVLFLEDRLIEGERPLTLPPCACPLETLSTEQSGDSRSRS